MSSLVQVFFGSLALSLVHAAIPNHWIPLVAIGKSEKWTAAETAWIAGITAGAHTASTILVGIVVGLIGFTLSSSYEFITDIMAPTILISLGGLYAILELRSSSRRHHHLEGVEGASSGKRSKYAIVASLCAAMFFSPCLEIEAYYFTAGTLGWKGIALVSVIYLTVTVFGIVVLVDLGRRGASRIKSHFLEHHEKGVTAAILIILGLFAYFVNI